MNLNFDGLHAVRDSKPSPRETWRPPTIADLSDEVVIAFDQSLNATAAMCAHRTGDTFAVRSVTMIKGQVSGDPGGTEGDLRKGVDLHHLFMTFLMKMKGYHRNDDLVVVHEAPPAGGGHIRRPESSLLAAQALRIAADRLDVPVVGMVSPGEHKRAICGNARAEKAEAHQALAQLAQEWPIRGYERVTNADKRDGLCVAIAYLLRKTWRA